MRTISGVFETREQAEQAVAALESAGVARSNISLVAPDPSADGGDSGILLTATVDEEQADVVEAILGNAGPVDVATDQSGQEPGAVLPGDRISDDPPHLPPLPR